MWKKIQVYDESFFMFIARNADNKHQVYIILIAGCDLCSK